MASSLPPLIDVHLHYGRLYVTVDKPLTAEILIDFMDRNGIQRAILLPIESPEEAHFYVSSELAIEMARAHPDRLIPGCNVDPRIGTCDNTEQIRARLKEYKDAGCKTYGEAMCGLYIDDPRLQRVYAACGEFGLPIIYHIDGRRNVDEKGFPRFEQMLKAFPDTVFVGHAQHFWAEISGDFTEEEFGAYPKRPVTPGGAIVRLLRDYANLYADLSARSAYNGITRDPEFGYKFLDEFQDRLFFGTDLCHPRELDQTPAMITHLAEGLASGKISEQAIQKICRDNAIRVFDL